MEPELLIFLLIDLILLILFYFSGGIGDFDYTGFSFGYAPLYHNFYSNTIAYVSDKIFNTFLILSFISLILVFAIIIIFSSFIFLPFTQD